MIVNCVYSFWQAVGPQRTHRAATTGFWRTFHHDGKISPGRVRVGGERAPHFTIFTITYKVAVYAPAERAHTLNLQYFISTAICTLWFYHWAILLVQGGEEKLDRTGWEEPRGDTPAQVGSSGLPQGRQKPWKDPLEQVGSGCLPQGRQGPQHLGDTHPEWRRWASDNAILR